MNILGLSCYYHDSAACLVQDGRVVAAAQEERFNRQKHSPDFPIEALNYCLQQADITINDVDRIAFYEKPFLKFERVLLSHLRSYPRSFRVFLQTLPPWLNDRLVLPFTIRKKLGYEGKVHFLSHHLSHAASCFLPSPFEKAAILTADGVGEWATTTLGRGEGTGIEILNEIRYPDSLGLVYSAVTTYLGFRAMGGEGKVMALADYGQPTYLDALRRIVILRQDGSFHVDPRYFAFHEGSRMYNRRFVEAFGKPRAQGEKMTQRHRDMAASLQHLLEDALIRICRNLHEKTGLTDLCLAGGVALNVSATSRILDQTPFERLFIQPAAGDSGGALGAALFVYHALFGKERSAPMQHAYLGPGFTKEHVHRFLLGKSVPFTRYEPQALLERVADMIADGLVVGWFQGRMEFGPRALGSRSILADPGRADMQDLLNLQVKHREPFRPYGVSLPLEQVGDYFEIDRPSPFMLQVAGTKPSQRSRISSAVHVNGTSRIQTLTAEQNGLFYDLVKQVGRRTGVPMVINTSFNDRGEPIVCTPQDAYRCFLGTRIDVLVMENCVVVKSEVPPPERG